MTQSANASAMLQSLWAEHALPQATLPHITLTGADAWLPSSFAVTAMAQSTIAAAAGMAVELGYLRCGHRQQATIDSLDAALECTAAFQLDGRRPPQWAKLSGSMKPPTDTFDCMQTLTTTGISFWMSWG